MLHRAKHQENLSVVWYILELIRGKPVLTVLGLIADEGRATPQAVDHYLLHRGGPGSLLGQVMWECGEQTGNEAGFLRILPFPFPILLPLNAHLLYNPRTVYLMDSVTTRPMNKKNK
jgi:hypothetical protein